MEMWKMEMEKKVGGGEGYVNDELEDGGG